MFNDKYEMYLDYQLIGQTTSAQEAISILLCLYNIFEIKFTRHSRGIHLLYGVVFQDQNELSKSLRKLLLSWDYTIKNKSIVYQRQITTTTTTTTAAATVSATTTTAAATVSATTTTAAATVSATTTMNDISVPQIATSAKTNENDSAVLEGAEFIPDQQTNNVNKKATPNSPSNNTQRLSKS